MQFHQAARYLFLTILFSQTAFSSSSYFPNLNAAATFSISGKVFEDYNYGGGNGRNFSTSGGSARSGARVELFNSANTFVSFATTDASGNYSFAALATGNYKIRVVNSTVTSSRTGYVAGLLSVQTFRTDASSGVAVDVINKVGGDYPNLADAGNSTLTNAQSVTPVTLNANVTGVDFGFNFDTIVNTNDSGQGSFRQFIANSNALANTGLAQSLPLGISSSYSSGDEVSVFMIPSASLVSGVATISVLSKYTPTTDSYTRIDGRTQTVNIGDTNGGVFGTTQTVGIDGLTVNTTNRPEVWFDFSGIPDGASSTEYDLWIGGSYNTVRGLGFYGAHTGTQTYPSTAVYVAPTVSAIGAATILENAFGTMPDGTAPATAKRNLRYGLLSEGVSNITSNYFAYNGYGALVNSTTANGSTFSKNFVENNGPNTQSPDGDQFAVWGSTGVTISGNFFQNAVIVAGAGTDLGKDIEVSSGSVTISNNTVLSGYTADIGFLNGATNSTVIKNIITGAVGDGTTSSGVGILLDPAGATPSTIFITKNSIYKNHGLGIDIDSAAWNIGDGPTLNDANDADAGPNTLYNFPQIKTASVSAGNLTIEGCAPTGSTIELFEADVSPTSASGAALGSNKLGKTLDYGEGERFLASFVEGVGEDSQPTPITCSALTDTDSNKATGMSPFKFTIATPAGLAGNDLITTNATLNSIGTSEFSPVSTVTIPLVSDLTLAKSHSGTFTKGSTGTYALTATNAGTAATSGTITITDSLPTGLTLPNGTLTLTGTNAANWSCSVTSNIITCTSSVVIAAAGTSTFSFTVNIALTAPDSITNTASISGGNEPASNNGNNSASDPTTIVSNPPNVQVAKSCTAPANCTTVAQNPGTDLTYAIQFSNTGGLGAASVTITDGVPTNTDFKLGSATVNIGTTGLTFVIEYSNNFDPLNPTLATWTYTPVSSGGGASSGYDRLVKAVRWRATAGTLSNVSPNNTGSVSFVTKIR